MSKRIGGIESISYGVTVEWTVLPLLLLVALVRVMLRLFGLGRTCAVLRLTPKIHRSSPTSVDDLTALAQHIAIASAFFPGRSRCLEQSVVLWYLARCSGIAADLKLGVRPDRFAAHAWVEYNGMPIGQSEEMVNGFVRLPAVAR